MMYKIAVFLTNESEFLTEAKQQDMMRDKNWYVICEISEVNVDNRVCKPFQQGMLVIGKTIKSIVNCMHNNIKI